MSGTRDGQSRYSHHSGHRGEDRGHRYEDGHHGAGREERQGGGAGYRRGKEEKLDEGRERQHRQDKRGEGDRRSSPSLKKRYRSPPTLPSRNEDSTKRADRRSTTDHGGKVVKEERTIDARDHGFKTGRSYRNEDTGYGSSFIATPVGVGNHGWYDDSRGWWGGRGRGNTRGFATSTPASGRGRARGGVYKEQVGSVGGRANDFLAEKCQALEDENKKLRAELPKAGTLQELESLKNKLTEVSEKLEKSETELLKMASNKYKHKTDPKENERLSKDTTSRVKKWLEQLLHGNYSKKDIKYAIRNLFMKLNGKDAWEEAIRMVRRFDEKEAVMGIITGLSEYTSGTVEAKDDSNGTIEKDNIENEREKKQTKSRKVERKISFSNSNETIVGGDENIKAPMKGKKDDDKKVLKSKSKPKKKLTEASPKAETSGTSKFASNKKKAFIIRTECNKKKQEEVNIEIFDDTTEDLDRGYNNVVLKRAGSPEVSAKIKAPEAPMKKKTKNPKTKGGEVSRKIAGTFPNDEEFEKVKYSVDNMVVIGVLGKQYNLQELRRTDKGGRVLDKTGKDLVSSYRCGFWPLCGGSVNSSDIMVRGGTLVEPKEHDKHNTLIYICSEHGGERVPKELEEEDDEPSIVLRGNKLCGTDSEREEGGDSCEEELEESEKESEDDEEQESDKEEGKESADELEENKEEDMLQSQSLLGIKK